jgi:hypothetical protein
MTKHISWQDLYEEAYEKFLEDGEFTSVRAYARWMLYAYSTQYAVRYY